MSAASRLSDHAAHSVFAEDDAEGRRAEGDTALEKLVLRPSHGVGAARAARHPLRGRPVAAPGHGGPRRVALRRLRPADARSRRRARTTSSRTPAPTFARARRYVIENPGTQEPLDRLGDRAVEQAYRPPREVIVRFADRPELRADAKRTFRYLVNQDAGCMDATQFVGIVEPCRAPDHSHTLRRGGLHRRGRGFRAHRRRADPPPAWILLPPTARAGSLHREHGTGRDADPGRLPPVGRSRVSRSYEDNSQLTPGVIVVGLVAVLCLVVSAFVRGHRAVLARRQLLAAACESPTIGFIGTDHRRTAAFIGKEQLGFARYAIRKARRRRDQAPVEERRRSSSRRAAARVAANAAGQPRTCSRSSARPAARRCSRSRRSSCRANRLPFISGSAIATLRSRTARSRTSSASSRTTASQPATIARHIRRVLAGDGRHRRR